MYRERPWSLGEQGEVQLKKPRKKRRVTFNILNYEISIRKRMNLSSFMKVLKKKLLTK